MGFSIYQEIFNNGSQRVCYNSFHGLRKENSSGTNNYSVNFEIYQEESGWVHLFLSFQEEDGQVCFSPDEFSKLETKLEDLPQSNVIVGSIIDYLEELFLTLPEKRILH